MKRYIVGSSDAASVSDFYTLGDTEKLKSIQDRIDFVDSLVSSLQHGKSETCVISETDLDELGKRELRDKLSDAVWGHYKEGAFLIAKYNPRSGSGTSADYIYYDRGWIYIPYLYNVAKYSMRINDVMSSSNKECYENLEFIMYHSQLRSVSILE